MFVIVLLIDIQYLKILGRDKKLWHVSEKVIIPAKYKKKILKQLDLMGINEQRLFPDIEHQLKYILEKYKNEKNA